MEKYDLINYLYFVNNRLDYGDPLFIKEPIKNNHQRVIILGKIYCQGFHVIQEHSVGNNLFLLLKKVGKPKYEKKLKTTILFKQERLGYKGKLITIHKFRTMYPYSECLYSEYLSKGFDRTLKILDDDRITRIGKILRKTWLDELPMIWNMIIGDLKLVGYRPATPTFSSKLGYENLKRRKLHKPGLIPVQYAEDFVGLDEFLKIESKYFDMYDKNPIITDIIYISKILVRFMLLKIKTK